LPLNREREKRKERKCNFHRHGATPNRKKKREKDQGWPAFWRRVPRVKSEGRKKRRGKTVLPFPNLPPERGRGKKKKGGPPLTSFAPRKGETFKKSPLGGGRGGGGGGAPKAGKGGGK